CADQRHAPAGGPSGLATLGVASHSYSTILYPCCTMPARVVMPVPPSTIRDAKLSLRCRSSLVDRGVDSSICGAITSTPTHALPGARFVRARQGRQDHVPPHSLSAAWLSRSARPPPFTETLNGRVYRTDG